MTLATHAGAVDPMFDMNSALLYCTIARCSEPFKLFTLDFPNLVSCDRSSGLSLPFVLGPFFRQPDRVWPNISPPIHALQFLTF